MNEKKTLDEFVQEVYGQLDYFNNTLDNPIKLLTDTINLKTKYGTPEVLYYTREMNNVHQNKSVGLINRITNSINFLLSKISNGTYDVTFITDKDLLYSMRNSGIEYARFSLVNKEYAYMNSVIESDEDLEQHINRNSIQINNLTSMIEKEESEIKLYEKLNTGRLKVLKYAINKRDYKGIVGVFVKYNTIKSNLSTLIHKKQNVIIELNRQIRLEQENIQYAINKRENSKIIVEELDLFFGELGYVKSEKHKFYK